MGALESQLSRHLPLLAIRADGKRGAPTKNGELVTLSVCAESDQPLVAVTAEFPAGFCLDASQFRLLKAGAYLAGLVGHWQASSQAPAEPPPAAIVESREPETPKAQNLPPGWHRVVVRSTDGSLMRGYSNDFQPDRAHLHLCPSIQCASAERLLVPVGRLKAVFFVKDLHGDPDRVDNRTFDHNPRARKIEVTFRDGEVMVGSTLNYKPNGQGFFLQPASSSGNNIRIYVVTPAIRHLRFV